MDTGASASLRGTRVCILRSQPVDFDKRTQQIAQSLVQVGADVVVVCLGSEDKTFTNSQGFSVRQVGTGAASDNPVRPLRILDNLTREARVRRRFRRAARDSRAHVFHAMNIDTLLTGFRAARGRSVIYDSREHFATTGNARPLTRWWWNTKERHLVPRSAAVITVSDPIADDMAIRFAIPRPTVLYNSSNSRVTAAAGPQDPLRFVHQGKLFFDRHLDDVIQAIAQLDGKAVLTLQGWGEAQESLRALAKNLGAESFVRFMDPCPPDQVVDCASQHDVGIINIWPDNMSHKMTGSNKLFDYMSAGLAEMCTDLDFSRSILNLAGCGVIFDPPTVEQLSKMMRHLVDHPEQVAAMKANAVAAAPQYSWEIQATKLVAAYAKAIS